MLELQTLGRLELVRAEERLLPGRRKLLMLLAFLALREGRNSGRSELAQLFWPEADEARARQSLRQAMSELRDTVGEGLVAGDDDVRLEPGTLQLDVLRFESASDRGDLVTAESLWQGEFLEGAEVRGGEEFRDWLEPLRERLRRRRARIGEALVRQAVDRGTWELARQHADRWAAALPLDTEASRRAAELRELASGRRSSPGGIALLTPDLVGRSAEFRHLTAAWQEVTRGGARVVLIEGDAGTGKTRLIQEFLRGIRQHHPAAPVVEVRAWESEQTEPLVLARHLLAPLANAPGVSAAPPAALHAIAAVAPEFGERFSALPAAAPDRLPEAVARVLTEVAAESPLIVAIDDAHFADIGSRELYEALCRRPVTGVLLVLTGLPEAVKLTEGSVTRLRLGLLDREQFERLVASMAEFRSDDRARLVGRLLDETGGNPLLAVELINALADGGQIAPAPDGSWITELPPPGTPLPLPRSLREQLAGRIRQLSTPARELLERCAVLARQATVPRVRAASGTDDLVFDTALDELIRSRLLRAPAGHDLLEFTHPAASQLVQEQLTPARRRALERTGGRRLTRRMGWLAGGGVVAAGLLALWWNRGQPIPESGPLTLRLVPIVAVGDSVPHDLLLAAHDALAAALEQGPGITVVDDSLSAEPALEIGARIELTGGRVSLLARATRPGQDEALLETRVNGAHDDLPATAARVANGLFPRRIGSPPFFLTSARTGSTAALRKYFDGLRLARAGQMEGAAQQQWLATRDDTMFAAAWHQLARLNAWFTLSDRSRRLADLAVARAGGLTQHDLMLLQGWQQFAAGNADDAEAHFRQVLGFVPDNQEAMVGLAEVLYHHAWRRGRDAGGSGPLWEAAVAADPHDWRPGSHRWELAARQRRLPEAARMLRASLGQSHDSSSFRRLLLAQFEGDTAGLLQRIAELPGENEWALNHLAFVESGVVGRLDLARACLRRLTEPAHSAEVRAGALEELAYVALAEGRWQEAQAFVAQARQLEPVSAAMTEGVLWAAPFLPAALTDSGRASAGSRLARLALRPIRRTRIFWFDYDNQRAPLQRWYLTELLGTAGMRAAPPPVSGAMSDSVGTLQGLLQRSLRARASLARGDTAEAESLLGGAWNGVEAAEAEMSVLSARPWDHFLRALLLESHGSDEEAVQWFASAGTLSIATLPYRAPAALHQARLLEKLGRPAEAVDAYRTVLRLWGEADAEFQPMVREARERVKALGGGPG